MRHILNRYVFTIGRWTFACGRWVFYSGIAVSVLLIAILVAARVWLPDIAAKKAEIETFVSEQTGLSISTSKIKPYWNGLYPGLIITDARLSDPEQPTKELVLSEIRASLAIFPFFRGSVEFSEVVLVSNSIHLAKRKSGDLVVNTWTIPGETKNAPDSGLLNWLAKLHHVNLIVNEFIWEDEFEDNKKFQIKNLDLTLDNTGSQHILRLTGNFPPEFCRSCVLTVKFTSDALSLTQLSGVLELDAIDLDIKNFPGVIKSQLPRGVTGRFQTDLVAEFKEGNLVSLTGRLIADDLAAPLENSKIVKVNTISGMVNWNITGDDWRLLVTDLTVGLTSSEWDADKFRFEKSGNKKLVYLGKARLNDLSEFISQIDTDVREVELIKKLKPGGEVRNLRLEFENNFSSLSDASVVAELVNLEISQVEKYPSAKGITGVLNIKGNQGEFKINSKDSRIVVPQIFRAPIETEYLTGSASWYRRKDAWEINVLDLMVTAKDVKAESNFQILLHDDVNRLPTVKVRVDFRDGRGYRTPLFYPKNLASPELLAWLDRALQSGFVNKGYAVLEGPLDNFPFKDGSGKFDVLVDISDATLDYLPGWAPLRDAEALLKFNGGEMVITVESGNINGLDIRGATAYANDLTTDEGSVIHISGSAYGPIESAINVLRKTPQGKPGGPWEQWLDPALHADGNGILDIDLSFKPGAKEDPVINGVYSTDRSIVVLPWKGIEVERLAGEVGFDEHGVKSGKVRGSLLGGPVNLQISREDTLDNKQRNVPLVKLKASGRIESREIADNFADWMQPYLSGFSDWEASLSWDEKIYFSMHSDLTNASIKLPAPFKKPDHVKSDLIFSTENTSNDNLLIDYHLDNVSSGKINFRKQKGKWGFYGAQIALMDAIPKPPGDSAVQVNVVSKNFDGDIWTEVLKSYLASGDKSPSYIDRIISHFDNVDLFDRHFGSMSINLGRRKHSLAGIVDGDSIAGNIAFNSDENSPELDFDLTRLVIPKNTFRDRGERVNPRGIPSMEIKTNELRFGDAVFGETILKGTRESLGYRLTRLVVNSNHYNMIGHGRWYRIGKSDDAEARLSFTSDNLGKALSAMGSPDQIAEGAGTITANLNWPKTQGISFAGMNGDAQLSFKSGRFLQVEQGAGRLLGVLDMSSILRYLRLDLSTIFSKGFLFNSMKAKFNIKKGIAHTNNLSIKGPSADMLVTGKIGISKQNFNLVVGVNPSLTDTLALTVGGLLAPQVGAAILILKNVFNTDVVPSPSINYSIKGTWDKPVVRKLTGEESGNKPDSFDDDSTS